MHILPPGRAAASVADSLISGLSIYTDHTHTGECPVTLAAVVGTRGWGRGRTANVQVGWMAS